MAWYLNLSTRNKLLLGFGLMLFFLAVIMATAHSSITAIQQSQQRIYEEEFIDVMLIRDIRSNQRATREDLLAAIMAPDQAARESRLARIESRDQANNRHFQELSDRVSPASPYYRQLQEFTTLRREFSDFRTNKIIPLIEAGQAEEAHGLIVGVQDERAARLEMLSQLLVEEMMGQVERQINISGQRLRRLTTIFVVIGLLAVAAGILVIHLMNRAIAGPLSQLSGIAESIAVGDLSVNLLRGERRDEVGTLARSFAQMVLYLRGLAEAMGRITAGDLAAKLQPQSDRDTLGVAVAGMTSSLRRMTGEIQESANILAAAASEIMSSTSEVASSVSETTIAVSQTTATVEEVKQTATVSDQKAQYVADTSRKAAQVSRDGTRSVEETIAGMELIREQMETIAASIIKLSEQSQAIGEIITTVNDLAEQSNLLAVNAAIEAAKAGEHGRGFGVVAREVKSLAEQSKRATAQVRAILSDIQKATGGAVLAAEQGSKSVEAGVRQAQQTGESIQTLGESIAKAAQAAAQITASSRQQVTGLEQIVTAMENIRQASEQNVGGTRQSESAAHNLHDLGQKLKELVDRYRV